MPENKCIWVRYRIEGAAAEHLLELAEMKHMTIASMLKQFALDLADPDQAGMYAKEYAHFWWASFKIK